MEEASRGVNSPVAVDVVFHVAGTTLPSEFIGVRVGRFRKKDAFLVVQAAVGNEDAELSERTLVRLLVAAIEAAEAYVRARRIAGGLPEFRRVVSDPRLDVE